MYKKNKQEINTNVISKIWGSEQILQKMDLEKVKTLIIFVFCSGRSVWVIKTAAYKRFSVRPCWTSILLKLQNSITGVFQCIFNKSSEHVFYRTTMNWYFGTKGVNSGHQLFCLSQELLQKIPKLRFFKFLLSFC